MNTDGSEDAQVHCLKPEGVAAGALPTIAAETARLSGEAREELDDDPFADLAELDENERLDKLIVSTSYCLDNKLLVLR